MIVAAGALIGAVGGFGLVLIAGGMAGSPSPAGVGSPQSAAGRVGRSRAGVSVLGRWLRFLAPALSGLVAGWLATGWPAFGATMAAGLLVARRAATVGRQRVDRERMADALAGWAEILADLIRSHSGLGQAVQETAPHTAAILRPAVELLAARIQAGSLSTALARFAADVDHPNADLLVAALRLSGEGGGRDLPEVLRRTAVRTRTRAEMLRRVEAGRARVYSEARAMVAVTGAMAAAAVVFGRAYLEPYGSRFGQLVLLAVGGLFCAAGLALVQLGGPIPVPAPLRGSAPGGGRR